MSSTNIFSRIPIQWQDNDLYKSSTAAGAELGATNYVPSTPDECVQAPSGVSARYRAPDDRVNGNVFFRRNAFNELDIPYSVGKVTLAIEKFKQEQGLDPESSTILNTLFPGVFGYSDGTEMAMARINLRLSPDEISAIRFGVAKYFQESMAQRMGVTGAGPHGEVPPGY